jgi:hypothetical protein
MSAAFMPRCLGPAERRSPQSGDPARVRVRPLHRSTRKTVVARPKGRASTREKKQKQEMKYRASTREKKQQKQEMKYRASTRETVKN